jgi:hypothetical protein
MKQLRHLIAAVAMFAIMLGSSANASEYTDLQAKMTAARESLVAMMLHADKRGPEQQKLVIDTANAVSEQLAKMKAPAGKEAKFKELVDNWAAFKQTRENELTTAILKGDDAKAKEIAGGIQKERLAICKERIEELDM